MHNYYLAFPIPNAIKLELERISYGLSFVQWMENENLFLIYIKLGRCEGADLLDIDAKLKEVPNPNLNLKIEGVEIVKNSRRCGEIRAKVKPTEAFSSFKKNTFQQLKLLPFFQENPCEPYVLLGHYTKFEPEKFAEFLSQNHFFNSSPFQVSKFLFLKGQMTPKHVLYVPEAQYP